MEKYCWLNNIKAYWVFICLILQSALLHAADHSAINLELSTVADLERVALENDKWHAVLPVLGDEKQYFLVTVAGKIYQLHDTEVAQSAFFDLKSALKKPDIIALTAITLDPNFHYRDQPGYHTFYTAHTEASIKSATKLSPKKKDIDVPFDTVIMRWKLASLHSPMPKVSQQHEVMRIAIKNPQEHIQQLSFNPYIEPWHDDFGLLFISLAVSEEIKDDALYAGSILRIKPEKYGLQSYTTPANNPFTKIADIPNEIALITGQKTEHFDWIKKGFFSLLIQFNQQGTILLVEAKIGDDWRSLLPEKRIKKRLPATASKPKTLLYQGREIKTLWGKALRLKEVDNTWQLQPIALSSTVSTAEITQDLPHKLIKNDNNQQEKFSVHLRHNGELLLLEHNKQRLYTIKKPKINNITAVDAETPIADSNNNSTFTFIFFMMFILMSYFWYLRHNTGKNQHFLHDEWANFDINLKTQSLALYKRHAKVAEKNISISSLIRSELLLNGDVISTVSADDTQAFSNKVEESTLAIFAKEHRLKMVDEKQRKIQLCLTDDKKKRYSICLYFRVGNIRHTKLKYSKVIDKAIDWQWLFAQYINPKLTGKRKILVKKTLEKTLDNTVIHTTTALNSEQKTSVHNAQAVVDHSLSPESSVEQAKNSHSLNTRETVNNEDSASHIDTKLVAALDKLVALKKQGYLDENEFDTAKTKILKDLADN